MDTERSRQSRRNPAIELLAQEWQVSIEQVEELYGIELAKLEFGARIKGFLPIFAIRKMQETRHQPAGSNVAPPIAHRPPVAAKPVHA